MRIFILLRMEFGNVKIYKLIIKKILIESLKIMEKIKRINNHLLRDELLMLFRLLYYFKSIR